jgi:YD repeat-containing protein
MFIDAIFIAGESHSFACTPPLYYLSSTQNGFGQLMEERRDNGTSIAYSYDALGRISKKTETINQNSFTFGYNYNSSSGMLETYTYPSGFKLKYVYNSVVI